MTNTPTMLTPAQIEVVTRMWATGEPLWVIAQEANVGLDSLKRRLRDQLTLPPRPRRANSHRRGVDPSQDEIRLAAAAIRQRWPEDRWLPAYECDGNRLGRQAQKPIRPIA